MAASAACGVLCLVLLGLWVRSYWWTENLIGPARGSYRLGVANADGWMTVRYRNGRLSPQAFPEWTLQSKSDAEMEKIYKQMEDSIRGTTATFTRPAPAYGWKENWGFQFPHWAPTALLGIFAVVAGWKLPWRLSLRTMFIAMTIAGVALGMIVWGLRRL